MTWEGGFGVHFLPHHPGWNEIPAPTLLEMADEADRGDIECIWFATRFLARDAATLMTMMAARTRTSVGTLVANPWGRNPLELVSALGTIGEILPADREVRWGIGTGVSHSRWVDRPKPIAMVRETIDVMRTLAHGGTVRFNDHPTLRDYFHLHGEAELAVELLRPGSLTFWFALTGGPLGDSLAVDTADGVFLDAGTVMGLSALSDGRLDDYLGRLDERRASAGTRPPLRRILNLCTSISHDHDLAVERARKHAVVAAGRSTAVTAVSADRLDEADLAESFLAGTPDELADRLAEIIGHAERLGCEHIVLGVPTGPDPAEAVELAGRVLTPRAREMASSRDPRP